MTSEVKVSDIRFIAFVNFMLALLFLEYVFFPATELWIKIALPGVVIFWNTVNLFVYSKRMVKAFGLISERKQE